MTSAADEIEDSSAPLIEHLTELRDRLIRCVIAFLVGMVICFTVWNPIFNFMTRPLCDALAAQSQACELIFIKLEEGFFVAVSISMLGGLMLAFPIISYQLWRFVAPGLYSKEKNAFLPFLIASPVMFFLGATFAYYVITPLAFTFFLNFQQAPLPDASQIENIEEVAVAYQGSAQAYFKLAIKFIAAFGLCFQLPVLLTLMGKAGLASSRGLAGVRKYAMLAILVVAAIATPPDVISQIILFTVVYGLYEVSIILVRNVERGKDRKAREEGIIGPNESLFDIDDDETDAEGEKAAH